MNPFKAIRNILPFSKRSVSSSQNKSYTQMAFEMFLSEVLGISGGITNISVKEALGITAIFAAIGIRGKTLASFPVKVLEGYEEINDETLTSLFKIEPEPGINWPAWIQALESEATLHGNAYRIIVRNGFGETIRFLTVPYYSVEVKKNRDAELFYVINGQTFVSDDVIHLRGTTLNGAHGLNPLKYLQAPLALARSLDTEAVKFFQNGCAIGHTFKAPPGMPDDQVEAFKKVLKEYRDPANAGKSLLLLGGIEYVTSRMSNKDAEFVPMKKETILNIAAWSGVPSHRLGDGTKQNYASQEESNREFLENTMLYDVRQCEAEFLKVFPKGERSRKRIKFNYSGFLRGNATSRADYYQKMQNMGAYDIDDILELEDKPPLPNGLGKIRIVPMNMQILTPQLLTGAQQKAENEEKNN